MKIERAIKILKTETECVERQDEESHPDDICDRNCGECDLVADAAEVKEAYRMAIEALRGGL